MVSDNYSSIPVHEWKNQLRRGCLRGLILNNSRKLDFYVSPVGIKYLSIIPEELCASFAIRFFVTNRTTGGSDYITIVNVILVNEFTNLITSLSSAFMP